MMEMNTRRVQEQQQQQQQQSRRGGKQIGLMIALGLCYCCCFVDFASGSSIPMWEFLTREEKMSQLYRIFSQEVGQFCADSSKPDCSKNLLITGLRNLANVDDDKLDEMDPYQRNAKDIIWRAMVGNNRQTASRLGQQSFHAGDDDPLAVGDNELPQESSKTNDYAHPNDNGSGPYLVGPMVIRVYPDGRPVPNDSKRPLPRDEDIDDILPKNKQLPSIVELESSASSKSENRQVPQQQQLSQHPVLSRQMLPPRFSFRRLGTGNRYYSPRLTQLRPFYPNNLLVRDRYY